MRMTPRLPLVLSTALLLAGCPGTTPTAPVGSPSAPADVISPGVSSVPTSGPPSAAPSVAASRGSDAPGAAPSAAAPPTPSPSPSTVAVETGIVKGRLLDAELKAMPDGTVVTASSLDTTQAYTASVTTADGNYVFNAIPLNVQIRLTATRPGWTTRTRVIVVRKFDPRLGERNVYNFGGAASSTDQSAPSYFLSPYPEIESVVPTDQDASLPLDKMSFKLTLSEPLDAANRRRLGAAFQIVPNNKEDGAPVTGATVTIKSLNDSVPYSATATTSEGAWVVNNVPEGANIEIIATKDGWTKRRQVTSIQTQSTVKNEINFGQAGSAVDKPGAAYFISDYPEIESTDPANNKTGVDVSKVSYKLKVSEPLNAISRSNLLRMLRIWPANSAAAGRTGGTAITDFDKESAPTSELTDDLALNTDFDTDANATAADPLDGASAATDKVGYVLREGSTFLGSSSNRATGTWNAEGTELTFTFNAALLSSKDTDAKYQASLISLGTATKDDRVEDGNGKQMGTKADGSFSGYEAKGQFVYNAFKEVDLATSTGTTAKDKWGSTHDTVVNFEVTRDETVPKLQSVAVSKNIDGNFRLELTYSEPMAAYNGTTRGYSNKETLPATDANLNTTNGGTLTVDRDGDGTTTANSSDKDNVLDNYQFCVSTKINGTDTTDLDGDTPDGIILDPRDDDADFDGSTDFSETGNFGTAPLASSTSDVASGVFDPGTDKTFKFAQGALAPIQNVTLAANTTNGLKGSIIMEVDKDKPSTVLIWLKGRKDFFGNSIREIKAFSQEVADPAGNKISQSAGKANQVKGTI